MNGRARASTCVALVLLVAGCAAGAVKAQTVAAAPPATSAKDPAAQLQRDLASIFSSPQIDHALWSVAVHSLKHDQPLFSLNATRMQTPASNQKLITTAVAAERLGWDYRYTTKIYGAGAITNGELDGNLVVVSNGDPTINPRHPERWGVFDAWAKQLHDQGLRRISGQLIGDDNAFAEPGWGFGWAWDDLTVGYGAPVGGLQYNENEIEVVVGPGSAPGSRGIISLSPPGSGLIPDAQLVTVAAGQPTKIAFERIPGANVLAVKGQIAMGASPLKDTVAAPNPTTIYLNALREALIRNGIAVGGNPVDVDELPVKPDYQTAALLLEDRSPTLGTVIDVCLKWSRNEYAETLLRSLAPSGDATAEAGLVVVNDTLREWGIAPELYVARDGSGLSRNDYLAPQALITLLTHMWRDPKHMEPFRAALPQAAVSGSLANRMKNTVAAERVWAKTGSMSNVRSLSGYLMTLDGEPMVFSFMATSFHVPASQIDAVMDEALVRLVKFPRELHEE